MIRDGNFLRSDTAIHDGLHGACAFPILLEGQILGIFSFFSRSIRSSESDVLELFNTIGSQIKFPNPGDFTNAK